MALPDQVRLSLPHCSLPVEDVTMFIRVLRNALRCDSMRLDATR